MSERPTIDRAKANRVVRELLELAALPEQIDGYLAERALDIRAREEQLAALQQQVAALADEERTLTPRLATLRLEVAALEDRRAAVQAEIAAIRDRFDPATLGGRA